MAGCILIPPNCFDRQAEAYTCRLEFAPSPNLETILSHYVPEIVWALRLGSDEVRLLTAEQRTQAAGLRGGKIVLYLSCRVCAFEVDGH